MWVCAPTTLAATKVCGLCDQPPIASTVPATRAWHRHRGDARAPAAWPMRPTQCGNGCRAGGARPQSEAAAHSPQHAATPKGMRQHIPAPTTYGEPYGISDSCHIVPILNKHCPTICNTHTLQHRRNPYHTYHTHILNCINARASYAQSRPTPSDMHQHVQFETDGLYVCQHLPTVPRHLPTCTIIHHVATVFQPMAYQHTR